MPTSPAERLTILIIYASGIAISVLLLVSVLRWLIR